MDPMEECSLSSIAPRRLQSERRNARTTCSTRPRFFARRDGRGRRIEILRRVVHLGMCKQYCFN